MFLLGHVREHAAVYRTAGLCAKQAGIVEDFEKQLLDQRE